MVPDGLEIHNHHELFTLDPAAQAKVRTGFEGTSVSDCKTVAFTVCDAQR
jgi:hypothetical protein